MQLGKSEGSWAFTLCNEGVDMHGRLLETKLVGPSFPLSTGCIIQSQTRLKTCRSLSEGKLGGPLKVPSSARIYCMSTASSIS